MNRKWYSIYFVLLVSACAADLRASAVGVYDNGSELLFLYSDGERGISGYSRSYTAYGKARFCHPSSNWTCIVDFEISVAVPVNQNVNEWCFAGYRFSREQGAPHLGLYRIQGKSNNDSGALAFLYNMDKGITEIFYGKNLNRKLELVSRRGVLARAFNEEVVEDSYLTQKELGQLINMCTQSEDNQQFIMNKILDMESHTVVD